VTGRELFLCLIDRLEKNVLYVSDVLKKAPSRGAGAAGPTVTVLRPCWDVHRRAVLFHEWQNKNFIDNIFTNE
jgi:hypothetical protein